MFLGKVKGGAGGGLVCVSVCIYLGMFAWAGAVVVSWTAVARTDSSEPVTECGWF